VIAAVLGVLAMASGVRRRSAAEPTTELEEVEVDAQPEAEAA
jgi:hypothetical protein